jgi:hypothetical protein
MRTRNPILLDFSGSERLGTAVALDDVPGNDSGVERDANKVETHALNRLGNFPSLKLAI